LLAPSWHRLRFTRQGKKRLTHSAVFGCVHIFLLSSVVNHSSVYTVYHSLQRVLPFSRTRSLTPTSLRLLLRGRACLLLIPPNLVTAPSHISLVATCGEPFTNYQCLRGSPITDGKAVPPQRQVLAIGWYRCRCIRAAADFCVLLCWR